VIVAFSGFRIIADTLTIPIMRLSADGLSEAVQNRLLTEAENMEAYAQENAPWADRTGEARAGLTAEVDADRGNVYVSLFHTVEYGRWLETIQAGRFAIIMPTIEQFSNEVLDSVGARRTG
jgi:hypothetical protein